jgi:antitoxin VapB
MKAKGLDAFVVRRNPNLAWAIAGRAHVPTTIDAACFDLIITQDSATAVTNVVEAPRLIAEELPSEVNVKTVKWSEGRDPQLPIGAKVGSDQPGGDRIDLGTEVEMMRASLIASDVERFKEICIDKNLDPNCSVSRSIGPTSFKSFGELMGLAINYRMDVSDATFGLDNFFNNA